MSATIPLLLDGYTDLPPGKLANVVTYLEMTAPPPKADRPSRPDLTVRRVEKPELRWYRALFKEVGEEWLWTSRLMMTDDEIRAALADPNKPLFVLEKDGRTIGFYELDIDAAGDVEISLFGVVREAVATGAARFLMDRLLETAFATGARRVWLHTCTFDHPFAVRFYRRTGFRAYKFAIELMDDPRLTGHMPEDVAPHIPVIRPK